MIVKKVVPSGYCKGVIRAINLAKKTKQDNPNTPIYILGNIVHNSYVTKELEDLGIITLDDTNSSRLDLIDKVDKGIVILSAHGTSDDVKEKALKKGLKVVDGTCEDVYKTKNLIIEYLNKDFDVIYFGKKNHPESNAVVSISNKIHLISNIEDIDILNINNDRIVITNQTTMSYLELEEMINSIKDKYPNAQVIKEICNATSSRQLAVKNIEDKDLIYVVGDLKSNNTNKLLEVSIESGFKKAYLISNKNEINPNDLIGHNTIYVTSGASTPPKLVEDVIKYLETI